MNKKGFTLVELLAVIAILALLVIIALPRVLEMFNNAKKELFLTEAKTIYKEVTKKYITENMKGNKIDKISNNKNKLSIESNDLKYDIKLDAKGNVKNFVVSNDTYCISGKFNNLSELAIDKVSDGPCSSDVMPVIAGTLRNDFFEVSGLTERSLVHSITFYSDNRKIDGSKYYNVSKENNDSIKMYIKSNNDNSELYDLTIVGDGKIVFPENSSNLFSFYYNSCGHLSNPTKTNNTVENGNLVKNMNLINDEVKIEKVLMACDIYSNLDEINFNNSIDTSTVTNMSGMFANINTETLDLSDFDTSSVENMSGMFAGNQATSLDLSSFDTSNVTDMNHMFNESQATTLDLSKFNTSKVIDMSRMFGGSQATAIDLSNFNTSSVTNMRSMFNGSQATAVDLSKFNTSKVIDMSSMFAGSKFTILNLSSFDTSNVTDMSSMFYNSKLKTIDLSSFNTKNVTDMGDMFENSSNLKTIYVSNKFVTLSVTYSLYMFGWCENLVGGKGTIYDSTKIDKTYARIDGGISNPGYFTLK